MAAACPAFWGLPGGEGKTNSCVSRSQLPGVPAGGGAQLGPKSETVSDMFSLGRDPGWAISVQPLQPGDIWGSRLG